MRLIYGTGNPAKITHMRAALEPIDIDIIGPNEVGLSIPSVDENGATPLENARIKALAYYKAFHQPVFSCDSGLYIDGLPDRLQPGVHVRNVGGKRLSDDEMVEYYARLIIDIGGQTTARYRNGVCLVMGLDEAYNYDGDDIASSEFILVSKPHPKRVAGFPLDSLSVNIGSGQYFYDMDTDDMLEKVWYEGFRAFFIRSLGLPLDIALCS